MDRDIVTERLRLARKRQGWRQEDLAERLGVHKATVCRHESGNTRTVDALYVARVAEVCGVDTAWILGENLVGAVHEPAEPYPQLEPREAELLRQWRLIADEDRRYIEGFLAARLSEKSAP